MTKLSTAVLAGGKSQRMHGNNKSFLLYNNQTFLEKILDALSDFDETLISVRTKKGYEQFSGLVEDEVKDIGPLGGLYSCLNICKNDYLFLCATDMPLLKKELIFFMLEFISSDYDCFIVQTDDKKHPLCGIYNKSILPVIKDLIKDENYRMMDLLSLLKIKYIPLAYSCFNKNLVSNINTEADYLKLKNPALFCVSGIKNSGKTTLITKLIKGFKNEGYKIGVIKHDGHEFEIDSYNKDTYKYRQAGSNGTVIYSQTQLALMRPWDKVNIDQLIGYLKDLDIIIIEGMKNSTYPKIELVVEESVCNERYLLAIATSSKFIHDSVPTYNRDDINGLVKLIKKVVLSHNERFL